VITDKQAASNITEQLYRSQGDRSETQSADWGFCFPMI